MDIKRGFVADLSIIKKNLLLLLEAKNDEPIPGNLWYQKELFLVSKNNKELEEEANFEPYFWGPYSESAVMEMEELVQLGLVKKEGNKYVLTNLGKQLTAEILKEIRKSEKEVIEDIKNFLNDLTKDELLMFTYSSYPEMIEDAVEFKQLVQKRVDIAISMYKKCKISLGKAAEIAGKSTDEMMGILLKKNLVSLEAE